MDWKLIYWQKQTQINKDNIHENIKTFEHKFQVLDKAMLNNHDAYKYETPYKGSFWIVKYWAIGTVTLQYVPTKNRYNIHWIKTYKSDTNIKYIAPVKCMTMSIYYCQLYTSLLD